MLKTDYLWELFRRRFPITERRKGAFSAPGRVNLIGEHTDYNDGFVLPMAIEKEIKMVGQLREDNLVYVYSVDYDKEAIFSLDRLEYDNKNHWVNYIKGVFNELQKQNLKIAGINLVFSGNIPRGAGLSSSAALEVVTAFTLVRLNKLEIQPVEMALLCQRAENNFVGVNCGIMDQYISCLGRRGHTLMIDCRSMEYELVPFSSEEYEVVICDSKVERGLIESEYNRRRKECQQAAVFFSSRLDHRVEALRDVTIKELEKAQDMLPDHLFRRARHVITENNRVLISMAALKNNDFLTFGRLMTESHYSLKDDFKVSCRELDLLVRLALQEKGVAGSRMTGAGFGGCTVSLVKRDKIEDFIMSIEENYREKIGYKPGIYVSSPAEGVKEKMA